MEPLYFGASGRELFGTYHPPEGAQARPSAVLICHPMPQEYMRSFWAIRRMADHLAKLGFHVLRFDYSGTGDSAGTLATADLTAWRADVSAAARELSDLSGGLPISVIGVRLGAAIALTTPNTQFRDVVLWDPVVRGDDALKRLQTHHTQRYVHRLRRPARPAELLGFEISRRLESDIALVNLLEEPAPAARRVAVMDSSPTAGRRVLESHLKSSGVEVYFEVLPEPTEARTERDLDISLIAPVSIQRICSWLSAQRPGPEHREGRGGGPTP